MPAIAADPILTMKLNPFLSFHHGSKIVGHKADIPSHTTLFALMQARSCMGREGVQDTNGKLQPFTILLCVTVQ
jgi:hypothetical protein